MVGPEDGAEHDELTPDVYDRLAELLCLDHPRVIKFLSDLHDSGLTIGAIGPEDIQEIGRTLTETVQLYMRVEHFDGPEGHGLQLEFNAIGFLQALSTGGMMIVRRPFVRHDYTTLGPGEILATHPADRCAGSSCCIHNPSDHPLRHAQLHWDAATRLMSRECDHRRLHPDPDHIGWLRLVGKFEEAQRQSIHSCCVGRCCRTRESVLSQ